MSEEISTKEVVEIQTEDIQSNKDTITESQKSAEKDTSKKRKEEELDLEAERNRKAARVSEITFDEEVEELEEVAQTPTDTDSEINIHVETIVEIISRTFREIGLISDEASSIEFTYSDSDSDEDSDEESIIADSSGEYFLESDDDELFPLDYVVTTRVTFSPPQEYYVYTFI